MSMSMTDPNLQMQLAFCPILLKIRYDSLHSIDRPDITDIIRLQSAWISDRAWVRGAPSPSWRRCMFCLQLKVASGHCLLAITYDDVVVTG